ncbi:hypothetical protein JTE90_029296 [Oedothorax gibbosus]|uniref:NADH dehydrogenase [ubiquinone] 1 beta subcomplex subunit 7 n=1 Tax=Oedothorax gibbosus TaxID=931172 RepID=A0AAV6U1I6_9ARAC|nr:hypothetical protein JTE90_029296 [Oedothorax gibbosus]
MGNSLYKPDSPPPREVFEPKFDPLLGFPNGRKMRTIKTTKEEMESAAVPPVNRDYCVDYYMKFLECRQDNFPLVYKCKHQVHDYHDCQFEDLKIRMKEYERERRLEELQKKKSSEMYS